MAKDNKLGSFASSLSRKNTTPIQKVVPVNNKPKERKFLLNLPENILEDLRQRAFDERTSIKTLILNAIKKEFYSK